MSGCVWVCACVRSIMAEKCKKQSCVSISLLALRCWKMKLHVWVSQQLCSLPRPAGQDVLDPTSVEEAQSCGRSPYHSNLSVVNYMSAWSFWTLWLRQYCIYCTVFQQLPDNYVNICTMYPIYLSSVYPSICLCIFIFSKYVHIHAYMCKHVYVSVKIHYFQSPFFHPNTIKVSYTEYCF